MCVLPQKYVQQSAAIATGLIMVCIFIITTKQFKTTTFVRDYSFIERSSKLKNDHRNDHSDIKDEDEPNPFFRKWRNYSCRKCLTPEAEFLISCKAKCKQSHLDMFILINSKNSNRDKRKVIRETWANKENLNKYSMDYVLFWGFHQMLKKIGQLFGKRNYLVI